MGESQKAKCCHPRYRVTHKASLQNEATYEHDQSIDDGDVPLCWEVAGDLLEAQRRLKRPYTFNSHQQHAPTLQHQAHSASSCAQPYGQYTKFGMNDRCCAVSPRKDALTAVAILAQGCVSLYCKDSAAPPRKPTSTPKTHLSMLCRAWLNPITLTPGRTSRLSWILLADAVHPQKYRFDLRSFFPTMGAGYSNVPSVASSDNSKTFAKHMSGSLLWAPFDCLIVDFKL